MPVVVGVGALSVDEAVSVARLGTITSGRAVAAAESVTGPLF
ncbi:hypothetical protein QIS99_08750 [Streptomyces sp. B-S-A8]|uniref:Uncharacterized protein n=1 Tax=Streptomyces solicavernae TaxID=3043614 RepID=A0ABT6RQ11_9ACTN|nr:hypothetical protein [Streptomyces sp. B-S-A8]MDI3386304.1 hypothetical protein [Streptomyces sp. B-S-A8]